MGGKARWNLREPEFAFSAGQAVTYMLAAVSLGATGLQVWASPGSATHYGLFSVRSSWLEALVYWVLLVLFAVMTVVYFLWGPGLSRVVTGVNPSAYYALRQLGAVLFTFGVVCLASAFTASCIPSVCLQLGGLIALYLGVRYISQADIEGDLSGSQRGTIEQIFAVFVSWVFLGIVGAASVLMSFGAMKFSVSLQTVLATAWLIAVVMTVATICKLRKVRRLRAIEQAHQPDAR